MKKETLIMLRLFGVIESSYSQSKDTIKGKLFFSYLFYEKFNPILVKAINTSSADTLNKNGEFQLITKTNKESYNLIFTTKKDTIRRFEFIQKWIKRKRPKSISLNKKCLYSKRNVVSDFKKNRMKLFVFNEVNKSLKLKKKDLKTEIEYKFQYMLIDKVEQFDCYYEYNKKVLLFLKHRYGHDILKKINTNVLGFRR